MGHTDSGDAKNTAGKTETTEAGLLGRSCEALLGICTGMMADEDLSDDEIKFLDRWLRDNEDIATTWPGEVIYARIRDVLADGVITEDEREHLKQTLMALIDGTLQETPAQSERPAPQPEAEIDQIDIPGRSFCFTGTFLFGPRTACERVIAKYGGLPLPAVEPDLDYLVVGAVASEGWADTDFARNVQQAMDYQKQGHDVTIIDEELWIRHLRPDLA